MKPSNSRVAWVALAIGLAALLCPPAPGGPAREAVETLADRQAAIQGSLHRIARDMEVTTDAEHHVRAVLSALATNEAAEIVRLLGQLPGTNEEETQAVIKNVVARQDRVIKAIEDILNVVTLLQSEERAESTSKPGQDMPPEVAEKLDELDKGLKEFLEEQKKVIETTNDLAKQPVDDFTAEEEQELKQLIATEDKWSTFLEEAYADLSKLPVQDYTNPSLLEELVQTYSEVEMAKDALQKEALEIATPMEEAGAELAESIETNLEKWLPDTPDRTRWQMEEPLQDYQAPMAELPTELQDLVGDLMEQEEDLMSDIEDASSSWADSLDKGAGWGAMDGPISNMTAKGVTGNRLPNTSEVGGRSGEGRTGKSSGEFVAQEAVGKGGRRTPTRLTPDPFEMGQVRDYSQEPPGGSTGGGKLSGSGGEGLEGPVPPELDRFMGALAGRQADLRNKAEKVRLAFEVVNYPTEDISDVIKLMNTIETDLRSRRYTNIHRLKPVLLDNLKSTHNFLHGELYIHHDRGLGLPGHVQDEIIEAAEEQTPQGYKELIRGYYEALNKTE